MYSSFLQHLSFTTNLLGSYYVPGAVVDPRGEGWVGTHHRVMETDKETTPNWEGQMEKMTIVWMGGQRSKGLPLEGDKERLA